MRMHRVDCLGYEDCDCFHVTVSLERMIFLESLEAAAKAAEIEIAQIGFPQKNGRYHKDGDWDFSKADPQNNPADLECITKCFRLLSDALRPNAQGQPAATEPAQQDRRGPLGCAGLLGADHQPEVKP